MHCARGCRAHRAHMLSTTLWTTPRQVSGVQLRLTAGPRSPARPWPRQRPPVGTLVAFQRAVPPTDYGAPVFTLLGTRRSPWPFAEVTGARDGQIPAALRGWPDDVTQARALARVVLDGPGRALVGDLHTAYPVAPQFVRTCTEAALRRGTFPELDPEFAAVAHRLTGTFPGTLMELLTAAAAITCARTGHGDTRGECRTVHACC